jgi:hypothetical protein
MTRLYGTVIEEDFILRNKAAAHFVVKHGPTRGIMDFSAIETIDMPLDRIVRTAQAPPILPGQARVIVEPDNPAYGLGRLIAAAQLFSRKVEPVVVRSLQDAYRALAVVEPNFEPVESDEAMLREAAALRVLARIDQTGRTASSDQRQRLRRKMLHLLDAAFMRAPVHSDLAYPAPHMAQAAITLGDVLNSGLRHTRVSDADLTVTCAQCRERASLAACRITARRETTYACPSCDSVLVILAPAGGTTPTPLPRGYTLGTFVVRPIVDIECPGAVLPKS